MKQTLFSVIFSIFTQLAFAQISGLGIPKILNHTSEEYKLETQNWSIVQDDRGIMYFANNGGILQYDGSNWNVIKTNNSKVKSLFIDSQNTIYVGGKAEFGYLKKNEHQAYQFVSLIDSLPEKHRNLKDIWQIFEVENNILFFTETKLIFYKNGKFNIIEATDRFRKAFFVKNRLFINERNIGIHEYSNGKLHLIEDSKKWAKVNFRAILPRNNQMIIVAYPNGFFNFDGKNITPIVTPLDQIVKDNAVYTAMVYQNKYYAFGLYTNGVLITDTDFNFIQYVNQQKGLQSKQVFAIYEDRQKNLWAALSNGISYIMFNSPFSYFGEEYAINTKVHASIVFDDKLYVGTPTGLMFKEWFQTEFKLAPLKSLGTPKSKTQTWHLDTINNQLLCASSSGLYSVKNNELKYIIDNKKTYTVIKIARQPNIALVGGADGFYRIIFENNQWIFDKKIENFKDEVRYAIFNNNEIWVSNITRGIYRLKFNADFTEIVTNDFFDTKNGLPENFNNKIFLINNQLFFGTEKGIYVFNQKNQQFIKTNDKDLAAFDTHINIIFEDSKKNIWFKEGYIDPKTERQNWEMGVFLHYDDSIRFEEKAPFFRFRNNIFSINEIQDDSYLIGLSKGFVLYNHKLLKDYRVGYNALVRRVELINEDSIIYGGEADPSQLLERNQQTKVSALKLLDHQYNNIRFVYSSTFYGFPKKNLYQFKLDDGTNQAAWSEPTAKLEKEYTNLHEGTYTFSVKALNIHGVESKEASYTFTISPPWYRTIWAYIVYFLAAAAAIWAIVFLSMQRLRRQNEMLERIVEERTAEIKLQKQKIEEINEDMMDSITYAKRIQEAMLPLKSIINEALPLNFILFKPRDIVSGDFYWFTERDNKTFIAAVDCTGHGVPGAFMSMIGSEILHTIINNGIYEADEILNQKNNYVRQALKQEQTENQDGMDMALCVIDKTHKTVEFAGAKNPLIYIQDGELYQIKGDKQSIGGYQYGQKKHFAKHVIEFKQGTTFYIFTDGYQDQFGGPKNRKFMVKRMKEMLMENHNKPMALQHQILDKAIEDWKKDTHQTDDILVIGFKIED